MASFCIGFASGSYSNGLDQNSESPSFCDEEKNESGALIWEKQRRINMRPLRSETPTQADGLWISTAKSERQAPLVVPLLISAVLHAGLLFAWVLTAGLDRETTDKRNIPAGLRSEPLEVSTNVVAPARLPPPAISPGKAATVASSDAPASGMPASHTSASRTSVAPPASQRSQPSNAPLALRDGKPSTIDKTRIPVGKTDPKTAKTNVGSAKTIVKKKPPASSAPSKKANAGRGQMEVKRSGKPASVKPAPAKPSRKPPVLDLEALSKMSAKPTH